MSTLYSQVWWSPLAPTPFPDDIVRRYNGSKMAVVGWEIDQVRRTAEGDVSVPISASYNHHYMSQLIGAGASFHKVQLDGPDDPRAAELVKHTGAHGKVAWDQPQYLVERTDDGSQHSHQMIQSGNGGEYRKTYHGFPPGFALVLDSPTAMQVTPMQIDTWNREAMDISGPLPPPFVPGPLPRASLAPADALHSGLLECPMTTRLTKKLVTKYMMQSNGRCIEPIVSYHECFAAAAVTLAPGDDRPRFVNLTITDASKPAGCSSDLGGGSKTFHVYFNELATSVADCGAGATCVCPQQPTEFGQASGALVYQQTNQSADVGSGRADYFGPAKHGKMCAAWPSTSILEQRNPTCDIRYYRGGQWACHHKWSLLDADQPIPWTDQPLVFVHKYRFWVQPFEPSYHTPVTLGEMAGSRYPNAALLLGSPWEYDVPKCAEGVAGCAFEGGMWVHTISGSTLGQDHLMRYVSLNNHCHAPTCLSVSVYACAKGTPLADCNANVGKLICRTDPVYGGTGNNATRGSRFDEPGYIAIPDCFWGDAEFGLEPPPDLRGVPIHVVKKANATSGHYGEMSGGQPWVF
jgi:hypothetical protein